MSPAEGHWAPLEALPLDEYEEIVVFDEWRTLRHHSSRSLTRTRALLDALGYEPHDTDHHILGVVGSKGKGTTAAYASACLAGVGHRVGTVMSPGRSPTLTGSGSTASPSMTPCAGELCSGSSALASSFRRRRRIRDTWRPQACSW